MLTTAPSEDLTTLSQPERRSRHLSSPRGPAPLSQPSSLWEASPSTSACQVNTCFPSRTDSPRFLKCQMARNRLTGLGHVAWFPLPMAEHAESFPVEGAGIWPSEAPGLMFSKVNPPAGAGGVAAVASLLQARTPCSASNTLRKHSRCLSVWALLDSEAVSVPKRTERVYELCAQRV